jgi:hypothetical protein
MVPNFENIFSISRRDVRGLSGETCKRYPVSPVQFLAFAARPLLK